MVRVQSVTWVGVLISPSAPSVRHWDRLCPSAVNGEGILSVVLACCVPCPVDSSLHGNDGPVHRPSGLRVKSAMTEPSFHPLWFPTYAGRTSRYKVW